MTRVFLGVVETAPSSTFTAATPPGETLGCILPRSRVAISRLEFLRSHPMHRLVSPFFLAAAVLAAQPALATASTKARAVHGVALSSLCKGCAVVSKEHTETRKGKPSGVGAVGGAVAGGVIGNQFGHGNGKAAMTVLGAVGGGVAGNEIEKNVKKYTVWVTTVTFKDGTTKRYERTSDPSLRPGDVVHIVSGRPVRRDA
jgi:uncharacterized protein YcfJ